MRKTGVGVMGASPAHPGWAEIAHIPAIRALPEFELRAVSTGVAGTAEAAARAYGVWACNDHRDLVVRPGVDLVVVAVRTPDHAALISAALDAGKMVFSEWPLGNDLEEAERLAAQARRAGLRTAIGLQSRYAPAIHHARNLVRRGFVGEVLATTLVGSAMACGAQADRDLARGLDAAGGATTLSVPMMHALDAMTYVLGDFASVAAEWAGGRSGVRVVGEDRATRLTASDHIALSGKLRGGAIVSAFYRGGASRGNNLRWEINGTDGDLVLTAPNGNVHVADLTLEGGCGDDAAVGRLETPPSYGRAAEGVSGDLAGNVMREYAALASDLRHGTSLVPGFDDALGRHVLLAAIERAARSGVTQRLAAAGRMQEGADKPALAHDGEVGELS